MVLAILIGILKLILRILLLKVEIMKIARRIFFVCTALLAVLVTMSLIMTFLNHEKVAADFVSYGYPGYIVYPLAIAKFLAIIVILSRRFKLLKEWAYAGLFYDFILATGVYIDNGSLEIFLPLIALGLLLCSYIMQKKLQTA